MDGSAAMILTLESKSCQCANLASDFPAFIPDWNDSYCRAVSAANFRNEPA